MSVGGPADSVVTLQHEVVVWTDPPGDVRGLEEALSPDLSVPTKSRFTKVSFFGKFCLSFARGVWVWYTFLSGVLNLFGCSYVQTYLWDHERVKIFSNVRLTLFGQILCK